MLGILMVSSALRIHGMAANAMWADELFSWRLTTQNWSSLFADVSGDVHPPLYFVLLKVVTSLLGDNLYAMRAVSVVPSALTCLVLFHFLWARYGRFIAVVATLILALSPASIYYAHQIRGYALCELFSVLVVVTLLRYLDDPRARHLCAFALSCITINYLHFIGPFVLAGVFALIAGMMALRKITWQQFLTSTAVLAFSTACLVPWLIVLMGRSHVLGTQMDVFVGTNGVTEALKVFVKLLGGFFAAGPAMAIWLGGLWQARRATGPSGDHAPLLRAAFWTGNVMALVPFSLFALMGILGGPFIRLHPAIVAEPWIALVLAAALKALPSRLRWTAGALYAGALIYSTATIPYQHNQVPIPQVLQVAHDEGLVAIAAYGDELGLTRRYLGGPDIRIVDLRTIPPDICGGKVGMEVTADDAAYDDASHTVTYGIKAPGGQHRQFRVPATMSLAGERQFPVQNTWKPGVVQTYRLIVFDTAPCPAPRPGYQAP